MAQKIIKVTILLRRDTLKNWTNNNPILSAGEMSYVTDVGKCKIGDGKTHWNDLPYFILETDFDNKADIIIKSESVWPDYDRVVSTEGTLYVYTADDINSVKAPKLRIGDGMAYICDLPFLTDDVSKTLMEHIDNNEIHITSELRTFWNNKVTAYIHEEHPDILVLDDGSLIL